MARTFEEVISSVFQDRTDTPLYPSFVFAWSTINWKVIYITLFVNHSGLPPGFSNKLDYVLCYMSWWTGLVYPFLLAGAFIFVFPYAANVTYAWTLKFRAKRLEVKQEKILKNRKFTQEEVDDRVRGYIEENSRLKTSNEGNYQEIDKLRKANVESFNEGQKFKVVSARWGYGTRWEDVTVSVASHARGQEEFKASPSTLGGADPWFGHLKFLVITYQFTGKFYCDVAVENDTIKFSGENISIARGPSGDDMQADFERSKN